MASRQYTDFHAWTHEQSALPKRAAYGDTRKLAVAEIGIDSFPPDCPFTIEQVEDETFWPEAPGTSS